MIKVGITGGIGAGKSYVATVFSKMGFPVYNADTRAKALMNVDPTIRKNLIKLLGEEAYSDEGLERRFVANKVFHDESLLLKLNQIVHPVVYDDFHKWSLAQNSSIVLKESALLLNGEDKKGLDAIVLVEASLETRIQRVLERDAFRGIEEVKVIIKKQEDSFKNIHLVDYKVSNDESEMILPQIVNIKKALELTSLT